MKKSYKWIIYFLVAFLACFVGSILKEKYELEHVVDNLDNLTRVDVDNFNAAEQAKTYDENRVEHQISYNINTVTAEELDLLPGIGMFTAEKIISFREDTGKINNLEELLIVDGIGEKMLEKIKPYLTVE